MRYLEELSQAPPAEEEEVPSAQPSPAPAVPAQEAAATAAAPVPARTADAPAHGWSKAERQRLAAALDALGPALLSRANLQPQEAVATWSALAAAVGGGRTAWETRLFAAEWLLRGGGAAPRATAAAPSSTGSQDQSALIEELVAEHAECEGERREAVRQWTETEALVTEIVAEHAGVEAERREALRRAEIAEEELSESNRMARVVAIDVIARNLAASAIQAQWRDFCSRRAFAEARRRWNMAVDTRAAAQLARVVMSAEATQQSLSSGPTPPPTVFVALKNPLRLGGFRQGWMPLLLSWCSCGREWSMPRRGCGLSRSSTDCPPPLAPLRSFARCAANAAGCAGRRRRSSTSGLGLRRWRSGSPRCRRPSRRPFTNRGAFEIKMRQ